MIWRPQTGHSVGHRLQLIFLDDQGGYESTQYVPLPGIGNPFSLSTNDFDRDGNSDFVTGSLMVVESMWLAFSMMPDAPVLNPEMITTGYRSVAVSVQNPEFRQISRNIRTVAGSDYWRLDADGDSSLDEAAVDYNLQYGEYQVVITSRANIPGDSRFTAGIRIDGTSQNTMFLNYPNPPAGDTIVFYYDMEPASSIWPPNGQPVAGSQPTFNWSGLATKIMPADSFQFQLDRYYDFRSPICDVSGLTGPSYQLPTDLGADSVYYWRIRSYQGGVAGEYSRTFAAYIVSFLCGEASGDGAIDISDAVYLIQYIFSGGPAPNPVIAGDANCDQAVDISDVVYLIQFIFSGGPAPCAGC